MAADIEFRCLGKLEVVSSLERDIGSLKEEMQCLIRRFEHFFKMQKDMVPLVKDGL